MEFYAVHALPIQTTCMHPLDSFHHVVLKSLTFLGTFRIWGLGWCDVDYPLITYLLVMSLLSNYTLHLENN